MATDKEAITMDITHKAEMLTATGPTETLIGKCTITGQFQRQETVGSKRRVNSPRAIPALLRIRICF